MQRQLGVISLQTSANVCKAHHFVPHLPAAIDIAASRYMLGKWLQLPQLRICETKLPAFFDADAPAVGNALKLGVSCVFLTLFVIIIVSCSSQPSIDRLNLLILIFVILFVIFLVIIILVSHVIHGSLRSLERDGRPGRSRLIILRRTQALEGSFPR